MYNLKDDTHLDYRNYIKPNLTVMHKFHYIFPKYSHLWLGLIKISALLLLSYLVQELYTNNVRECLENVSKRKNFQYIFSVGNQFKFLPAINSWLKAQNPQGMHAGRQISHNSNFWYFPNSPIDGSNSSKSKGS